MLKTNCIFKLLLLSFFQISALLAQNDLQQQAEQQQGFLLNMPKITNPSFEWGLKRISDVESWWSKGGHGINFVEFELVFSSGRGTENFQVTREDSPIFTTEQEGNGIVKLQIGLVGFGNRPQLKKKKKKQDMTLEFMAQPSNILQQQQPLTNLLIDAIKNNDDIDSTDLNNIYVICDQISDDNDRLGYEKARCLIWYRSTAQLIPHKVIKEKSKTNLPRNYHYYYIQLDANSMAFNEREILVNELYDDFDSLKLETHAIYHLYIANGSDMIIVEPNEDYKAALNELLELSTDPPSIEAHRDKIWQHIGEGETQSYMQKLAKQQQSNGDLRYGNVYFHYYLSESLIEPANINDLICIMFSEKDKELKNFKVYIHKKNDGKYEQCLLDHTNCDELNYQCE